MNAQPETGLNMTFDGREAVGRRLLAARKNCNLSRDTVVELAESGFSRSSLQAWEAGEREPSYENLFDLSRIYNVHPWELLTGAGDITDQGAIERLLGIKTEEYVLIPAYDIEVSAGHGMFSDGSIKPDRFLAFRKRWVKARGFDVKYLVVLFARGDSMEPTIVNGAAIVLNLLKNHAMDGKIYVVRISDRLWVKRIQWTPDGGLRLISDNKEVYDPFDIARPDLEHMDIEIIGEVIHTSYDLPD